MPELRVVVSRICRAERGFGRWVERFVGFGLPVGYGVVFALDAGFLGLGWREELG